MLYVSGLHGITQEVLKMEALRTLKHDVDERVTVMSGGQVRTTSSCACAVIRGSDGRAGTYMAGGLMVPTMVSNGSVVVTEAPYGRQGDGAQLV